MWKQGTHAPTASVWFSERQFAAEHVAEPRIVREERDVLVSIGRVVRTVIACLIHTKSVLTAGDATDTHVKAAFKPSSAYHACTLACDFLSSLTANYLSLNRTRQTSHSPFRAHSALQQQAREQDQLCWDEYERARTYFLRRALIF